MYNPARGGHAPGYFRNAFEQWIDTFGADGDWLEEFDNPDLIYLYRADMQRRWEAMTRHERALWLTGQL